MSQELLLVEREVEKKVEVPLYEGGICGDPLLGSVEIPLWDLWGSPPGSVEIPPGSVEIPP